MRANRQALRERQSICLGGPHSSHNGESATAVGNVRSTTRFLAEITTPRPPVDAGVFSNAQFTPQPQVNVAPYPSPADQ